MKDKFENSQDALDALDDILEKYWGALNIKKVLDDLRAELQIKVDADEAEAEAEDIELANELFAAAEEPDEHL